jgi:hypothetical protein
MQHTRVCVSDDMEKVQKRDRNPLLQVIEKSFWPSTTAKQTSWRPKKSQRNEHLSTLTSIISLKIASTGTSYLWLTNPATSLARRRCGTWKQTQKQSETCVPFQDVMPIQRQNFTTQRDTGTVIISMPFMYGRSINSYTIYHPNTEQHSSNNIQNYHFSVHTKRIGIFVYRKWFGNTPWTLRCKITHCGDFKLPHMYALEVNELVQGTFPLQVIIKIKMFLIIQPNWIATYHKRTDVTIRSDIACTYQSINLHMKRSDDKTKRATTSVVN